MRVLVMKHTIVRVVGAGAAAWSLAACLGGEEPPDRSEFAEEVSEATDEMTVCAGDDVVHGIDVSYYQGDIDWPAVAGSGRQFAITRINHSDFMDPKFDQNWEGIKAAGMIRGAYQYFEPGEDVAWQAQVVIDKVGILGPGDLPCVIDVETTTGLGPAAVAQAVGEWLELVEQGTGKKPIIYAGKYFWQDNVGSADYADYPLWHAQYPNACQPPNAPPPECGCANIADQWTDFAMWQYSSSGSIPGISGNVDINVFKGTYDDLLAFASQGSYGAALLSVDAPSTVLAGESFTARVTYTNTGGAPWNASTALGTSEPRDRVSDFYHASWPAENRAASVSGEPIALGGEYTFEFTMRAPSEPGSYTEHFAMVQEAVAWFADQGGPADGALAMTIQVVDGPGPNGAGGGGVGGAGEGGAAGGATADDGPGDDDSGCDCSMERSREAPPSWGWVSALGVLFAAARRRSRRVGDR